MGDVAAKVHADGVVWFITQGTKRPFIHYRENSRPRKGDSSVYWNRSSRLAKCSDVSTSRTHHQLTRRRPIGMGAPLVPAIRVHRTSWRGVLVGLEHRASCRPVYLLHLAKMLRILNTPTLQTDLCVTNSSKPPAFMLLPAARMMGALSGC